MIRALVPGPLRARVPNLNASININGITASLAVTLIVRLVSVFNNNIRILRCACIINSFNVRITRLQQQHKQKRRTEKRDKRNRPQTKYCNNNKEKLKNYETLFIYSFNNNFKNRSNVNRN